MIRFNPDRHIWGSILDDLRAERDNAVCAYEQDPHTEEYRQQFLAAQAALELHQMLKPKRFLR